MHASGALAARCAAGYHQWRPLDGCRESGSHEEACDVCGRSGVWRPVIDVWPTG